MQLSGMDTGLHSLVAIGRFHQLPAEPEQLAHEFAEPGNPFSDLQLLSAAKALTLRAKRISLTQDPVILAQTISKMPQITTFQEAINRTRKLWSK